MSEHPAHGHPQSVPDPLIWSCYSETSSQEARTGDRSNPASHRLPNGGYSAGLPQ